MKEMSMPQKITNNDEPKRRSSLNASIEAIEHYNIDISKLIPYSKQARKTFDVDELKALANSIQEYGLRQPLTIMKSPNKEGFYEVVSGERRLLACQLIEMQKVPCIVLKNDHHSDEIALIENIQRTDLTPLEMGEAFHEFLKQRKGMTQVELGKIMGISSKVISERIALVKLPEEVKDFIRENRIVTRHELRNILSAEIPGPFAEKKPVKSAIGKGKKQMVLRIDRKDGDFIPILKSVSKLSHNEKEELKWCLQEIIDDIQ